MDDSHVRSWELRCQNRFRVHGWSVCGLPRIRFTQSRNNDERTRRAWHRVGQRGLRCRNYKSDVLHDPGVGCRRYFTIRRCLAGLCPTQRLAAAKCGYRKRARGRLTGESVNRIAGEKSLLHSLSVSPYNWQPYPLGVELLPMETTARPGSSFRMAKYVAAVLLIVISGACLTLSYIHEGWFGKVFRVALGLGLPW